MAYLNGFRLSDEIRYRPILDMDSIPESFRKAGYGGVDRFSDLKGYHEFRSADYRTSTRLEEIKNMANVQKESFKSIAERASRMEEYDGSIHG